MRTRPTWTECCPNRRTRAGDRRSVSAGGMPDRVKCLHALLAHALAAGPGVNPMGDEVLARIGPVLAEPVFGARFVSRVAAIDCGTTRSGS